MYCAKEVILSAGAIGSPHILQHSGVGDGAHLKSFGLTSIIDAPAVGKNLQDHLFGYIKYRFDDPSMSLNAQFASTAQMGVEAFKWLFFGKGGIASTTCQIYGFKAMWVGFVSGREKQYNLTGKN